VAAAAFFTGAAAGLAFATGFSSSLSELDSSSLSELEEAAFLISNCGEF
jgi:hypothetical protein